MIKEHGAEIRALIARDPKLAALAELIGLTKAQLLEAVGTMEEPTFVVAADYSLEEDIGGIERAVRIVREKLARQVEQAKDAVERSTRRLFVGPERAPAANEGPQDGVPAGRLAARTRC